MEGDWPDCYKINRYVRGYKDAGVSIENVLKNFDRWPTLMWGNWEVAALAQWLAAHGDFCIRPVAAWRGKKLL